MGLNRYRFSYANIPKEEFQTLSEKIEAWSFNGLHYNWNEMIVEFYLDEKENPNIFNIPNYCHLIQIL